MADQKPLDYEPASRERRSILNMPLPWWLVSILLLVAGWLVVSVLTVNGVRPRRTAYQAACAAHLYQIGQACAAYADSHHAFPPDLPTVMLQENLDPIVFVCLNTDDTKASGATLQDQVSALAQPGHCSYVYVGAYLSRAGSAGTVVAFEDPANHEMRGASVLYGDGHVAFALLPEMVQFVPELEAGRNPPTTTALSQKQAEAIYEKQWKPRLAAMKTSAWAAGLPRPATQPAADKPLEQ